MHAGTVAVVSDGSSEEAVIQEARLAATVLGCYAYKLGGPASDAMGSLLPNISGIHAHPNILAKAVEVPDHP